MHINTWYNFFFLQEPDTVKTSDISSESRAMKDETKFPLGDNDVSNSSYNWMEMKLLLLIDLFYVLVSVWKRYTFCKGEKVSTCGRLKNCQGKKLLSIFHIFII